MRAKRTRTSSTEQLALIDWIPKVSPELERPTHLEPICEAFERIARGETVELAISVPPRHWKTTTLLHGIVWLFERIPGFRIAYLTYALDFAEEQSRATMRVLERSTLGYGDRKTFSDWNTSNGGSFTCAGLIGGVTGRGFHLVVVDDPYRKREDADSKATRHRISESFAADVYSRQLNEPTSFLVQHARWREDDLIAEITSPDYHGGHPFDYVNLPAINANGEALCPKWWPVERFEKIRTNAREWYSLYQGQPLPPGGKMFNGVSYYRELPHALRYSIGLDLAYTAKTTADWSVSLVLAKDTSKDPRIYVVDVVRAQVQARDFEIVLRNHQQRYPGTSARWHTGGGGEKAVAELLAAKWRIDARPATTDKRVRATPVSDAWNAGKILVPEGKPWVADFLDELHEFTGTGDDHDDQIDALGSAYEALPGDVGSKPIESSQPRSTRGLRQHY